MSETNETPKEDAFKDHLVVTHSDGNIEKFPLPEDDKILKIGRELDNDVVLTDPRSSRYHAELRRAGNVLEVKDLNSANGVIYNEKKIEPDTWVKITPRMTMQMAETRLVWEKATSSQSTVVMARQRRDETRVSPTVPPPQPTPAPTPAAQPQPAAQPATKALPWVLGIGVIVALLVFLAALFLFNFNDSPDGDVADQPTAATTADAAAGDRSNNLDQQSTSLEPTNTPTPSGPQLAIPVVDLTELQVSPIIFGASPNTTSAYLFIDVRVRNAGNIPFIFSINNFSLRDRLSGETFIEAGSNTSENYLNQLGAIDRFQDLGLTPGGSVPGSLVFELEIGTYDFELVFDSQEMPPVVLGLGTVNMRRQLDLAAGTPLAELDADEPTAVAAADTPTPTPEPTPTATRPAEIPSPVVVPRSALRGTIAYPVFDGEVFNIYIGDVESSETLFFRSQASQPSFSADGSRIAFHSWDDNNRGLITMGVDGSEPRIVASFIEDQLPTWTADGSSIVFLSRRSGDRKSNLIMVDSSTERTDGTVLGEGEYPTIGQTNDMVFKGWGTTAFGLRVASPEMSGIESVTNVEEDTAPSISPDGSKVAFMSRRDENWDIYVSNIDGSDLQRLTRDASEDGLPTWSPTGNAIAFVSNRGGPWAVWVMTPDGKGISQLFTMQGTPDGFVGGDSYASRGWAEERISWTDTLLVTE